MPSSLNPFDEDEDGEDEEEPAERSESSPVAEEVTAQTLVTSSLVCLSVCLCLCMATRQLILSAHVSLLGLCVSEACAVSCALSAGTVEKTAAAGSDEEAGNPFTNTNSNPFEDEPCSPCEVCVPVRALYDYEGRGQDELSFRAGTAHRKSRDQPLRRSVSDHDCVCRRSADGDQRGGRAGLV